MRLSELANLQLSDINVERGIIKVIGKGNKERLVRIGLKTQKALWSYLARRDSNMDHVWLRKENQPLTATGIAQRVRNLGKGLGLSLCTTSTETQLCH